MRSHIRKFSLIVLSLSILVCFQNCGPETAIPLEPKEFLGPVSSVGAEVPAEITGNTLEAKAVNLLQNKCFMCHGPANSVGVSQINNPGYLISIGQIIPGNPAGSPIYLAIVSGGMPIGGNLTPDEKKLISDWIIAGAKTPTSGTIETPELIPLAGTFKSVQANIIIPKCLFCHSMPNPKDHVLLDTYTSVKKYVIGNQPNRSKLYEITMSGEMPTQNYPNLTNQELMAIKDWIISGAPNN